MELAIAVLSSVAVSTVLTTILGFILQTIIGERLKNQIKNEYDEKLETHKAELKSEQDKAMEQMKYDLRLAAFQHETRFAGLQAKRATIIADVFRLLRNLHTSVGAYIAEIGYASEKTPQQQRSDIATAFKAFEECFFPQEIFLPEKCAKAISNFHRKHFRVVRTFMRGIEQGGDRATGNDSWRETSETMENERKPIFEDLKAQFRELLGDVDPANKP